MILFPAPSINNKDNNGVLFPRWKKIKELFPAVGNEWKKYINISPNKRIEWAKRTSEFMVKYKYIFWMSDRRREIIPLFFFTEGIITLFHMAPCPTKKAVLGVFINFRR